MTISTHEHGEHSNRWNLRFLQMAKLVASWSKDPSTQVGAVIVDAGKRVTSVGFNGFPRAMPDIDEHYASREEKYSRIIHAEINALIFSQGRITPQSTLYTWPFLTCDRCVVQMLQAGIRHFVAPMASEGQLDRWGSALERTKQYIIECGGTWLTYALEDEDFIDTSRVHSVRGAQPSVIIGV